MWKARCRYGNTNAARTPSSADAAATRNPVSRYEGWRAPIGSRVNAIASPPSSSIVTAPAPADASGRKSLSQSEPGSAIAPTMPVNTSAAATGVPNSAPSVPETASITSSAGGILRREAAEHRHGERGVDRDRRVLGAEAHSAREAQDRDEEDRRDHPQLGRRAAEFGRGRVGAGVPWHEPGDRPDRRAGEGQHEEDPPRGRFGRAEVRGQRGPQEVHELFGHEVDQPQHDGRADADQQGGNRHQQQYANARQSLGLSHPCSSLFGLILPEAAAARFARPGRQTPVRASSCTAAALRRNRMIQVNTSVPATSSTAVRV